MDSAVIKVTDLTKSYKLYAQSVDRVKESLNIFGKKYHKDFHAVKGLSFEVRKGETVGIIGRNGCGKSTLLKMITNVLTPTTGEVIVHGHISAILELGGGFNPEMTGLENIYLNASINGFSKEETDQIADEVIQFSELGKFIHQPIKTYSSGMNARLAFAMAINVKPDILIIDEALSVGDVAFQRKCFAKIEEIRANGATVLFVSHSEGSVVSLCNRAIWLSNGEMVIDGVPKLVTGLYLKYSNANKINKEQVSVEYQELVNKSIRAESQIDDSGDLTEALLKVNECDYNTEEFYSTALKPASTIYYEEKGARIDNVSITTLDEREVNVLVQGREYFYQYTVAIEVPLRNVQFGFLIKTKNGVALGGGAYPDKNGYIDELSVSSRVKVKFKCEFNNGEYFFNAGVIAEINEEVDYAHRIIDAYMIKVIDADSQITGPINFISDIVVEDI